MSEPYRDPWLDYKAILDSMKKKFLKKPNYSQALADFNKLALRFKDEDCDQYAAMCYYQMAKIYEETDDWLMQYRHLLKAARLFKQDEEKSHNKTLVRSGNLNHMQDCYNHAVQLIYDHGSQWEAGLHTTELANALRTFDRPDLALQYHVRGAELLKIEHQSHLHALKQLAECQTMLGLYSDALTTVDELWTAHMKTADDPKFGFGQELLKDCEIACVLLVLKLQRKDLSPRHRLLLNMYVAIDENAKPQARLPVIFALPKIVYNLYRKNQQELRQQKQKDESIDKDGDEDSESEEGSSKPKQISLLDMQKALQQNHVSTLPHILRRLGRKYDLDEKTEEEGEKQNEEGDDDDDEEEDDDDDESESSEDDEEYPGMYVYNMNAVRSPPKELPPKESALNATQFLNLWDFVNSLHVGAFDIARKSLGRLQSSMNRICQIVGDDLLRTALSEGPLRKL